MNKKEVRLGDICTIKGGYAFKSKDFTENGIPVIRIANIVDKSIEFNDGSKYLPTDYSDKFNEYLIKKGDILVALSGATTGKYGMYDYDYKALLNQRVAKITPNLKYLDPRYLFYYMSKLQSKILYKASGAAQPNISTNEISNFSIPLPSIREQQEIVKVLDKAKDLKDKRTAQIEALDQLMQSVFSEKFGDPLLNQMNWPRLTLPDFVTKDKHSIKRGPFGGALKKEIFVKEGYLVYEQFHAINDDFSLARYFITKDKFEELKAFEVKPKDLIISCSGVTLGRIAEIPNNAYKGIINQALLKITLNPNKMNNTFFKFLFRHPRIQDTLFSFSRGSGIPNFPPMSVIKTIEFVCPPIGIQNEFEKEIELIVNRKTLLSNSLDQLDILYESLMQRAFKGELFTNEKISNT